MVGCRHVCMGVQGLEIPTVPDIFKKKYRKIENLMLIFTRTSMPRLRQNDRERTVGMVQTGISHQTVADHFKVFRITNSM